MARKKRMKSSSTTPSTARMELLHASILAVVAQRAEEAERRLRADEAAPLLPLSALPAKARQALALSEVSVDLDYTERQSLDGVQRASGIFALEQNPDLRPYAARGLATRPGAWWDLANTPEVAARLLEISRELSAMQLRLEPAELPEWASDVDEHLAALQLEVARRWWHAWVNDPKRRLRALINDVASYVPTCGFCLAETTARWGVMQLSDGLQLRCLIPDPPSSIAPWTTRYWVHRGATWEGSIFDFASVRDKDGDAGEHEVFIPADKLLHIALDQVGGLLEGRSMLRPCFQQLHQLRDLYRLQALGAEIHAVGELWFTQAGLTAGAGGAIKSSASSRELAILEQILVNRGAVFVTGAVLPPGVEPVYGKSRENVPDLSPQIRTLREAIAMVMGNEHRLMGTTGGSGTYAARKDASADAAEPLDFFAELLVARPLEDTLARFLALAFPGAPLYRPRVCWGNVETDTTTWVQNVALAREKGLLTGDDIEDVVREKLDLPERQDTSLVGLGPDAAADPVALPGDRFIPIKQAAEIFGVSRGVIRRLIDTGELAGKRVGRSYSVSVASLRAFIDSP